jgi:DNA-binding response OmpR family regulator
MKKKVLIIDDELDLCFLLKMHLISKQYDVEMAYNLKDGLLKLDSYEPDVLFLDNNLPDGHGWENLGRIRKEHPLVKINLISGESAYFVRPPDNKNVCVMEKPLSGKEIDKCLSLFNEN